MEKGKKSFNVSISFEMVSLPPFRDIMLLGKRCPHGKVGISKCFNLLAPDSFDLIEVDDDKVGAMLVSKQLLKRIPAEKIVEILQENVFPHLSNCEIVKVEFNIKFFVSDIEGTLE